MKKETKKIISNMVYFVFFLIQFMLLLKYPNQMLKFIFNSMFIYTVYTLAVGISMWVGFTDVLHSLVPYIINEKQINESFKKDFWEWLKNNTNFYLCRGHHKEDIENSIDYCIYKRTEEK